MATHNERCKQLVTAVENISENEMEEIFKMIHSHGCTYTRNNNGLFINLTWISEDLLTELEHYVKFCKRSQTELKKYESLCHVLNNKLRETSKTDDDIILTLDIKINENLPEIDVPVNEDIDAIENDLEITEEKIGTKISSSMKFSLLKKKYAKIGSFQTNTIENDLKLEEYIC
jgi:hypothetical protein